MSLTDISKHAESVEGFIGDLADAFRKKHWVKILSLLGVAFALLLNPVSVEYGLKLLGFSKRPDWYSYLVWAGISAAFFVAAFIVAIRTAPASPPPPPPEGSARKGLRPFEFDDAEIFTRLEREESLKECLLGVTAKAFRFGLICGESGCGKSSFLRAGLWPRLIKNKHRCVYVEFTHLHPLECVRQALVDQQVLSKEQAEQNDFLALIDAVAQSAPEPVVFIFDQFEQFFVHHKSKSSRKDFVQDLATWYQQKTSLAIKIIVSIRGDFADRLIELQKAMGYTLGPHESFRLEGFQPEQATAIFRVIAENEGIKFDEDFAKEMVVDELASREDGLTSPVDIQILAWMIAGQSLGGERAFNRVAYQKLGGVEGLLERFLKRILSVRETDSRRQAAVKVLLALTDLERDTRAGALKLDELREKIGATASAGDVEEAVKWLVRSDVRLVTVGERKGASVYELAHERLIPALRRLAGQALSEADRANQLLDRRVNEWLGNNRASRYLLTLRELRLIKRHKPYLTWGPRRSQKEALLMRSRRRSNYRIAVVTAFLLSAVAVSGWWFSPWGQIWQISRDLAKLSNGVSDTKTLEDAAISAIKARSFQLADQLLSRISIKVERRAVLIKAAREYIKVGEKQKAINCLTESLDMRAIYFFTPLDYSPGEEFNLVIDTAEAYAEMDERRKAEELLAEGDRLVSQSETKGAHALLAEGDRLVSQSETKGAHALIRLARMYIKLGKVEKALAALSQAEEFANDLSKPAGSDIKFERPRIGFEIAATYAQLGQREKATDMAANLLSVYGPEAANYVLTNDEYVQFCRQQDVVEALAKAEDSATLRRSIRASGGTPLRIAEMYIKLGEKERASDYLHKEEEDISRRPVPEDEKVGTWLRIARLYAQLGSREKASGALAQAARQVKSEFEGSRNQGFWEHAQGLAVLRTCIEVGRKMKDISFLERAADLSEKLPDVRSRDDGGTITTASTGIGQVFILIEIAEVYIELGEKEKAAASLRRAKEAMPSLDNSADVKGRTWARIAHTYIALGDKGSAAVALAVAEKYIGNMAADKRADVVSIIAKGYARLGHWRQARQVAQNTGLRDKDQVLILSRILRIWATPPTPILVDDDEIEEPLLDSSDI